jgi:hypothetical protein
MLAGEEGEPVPQTPVPELVALYERTLG